MFVGPPELVKQAWENLLCSLGRRFVRIFRWREMKLILEDIGKHMLVHIQEGLCVT